MLEVIGVYDFRRSLPPATYNPARGWADNAVLRLAVSKSLRAGALPLA